MDIEDQVKYAECLVRRGREIGLREYLIGQALAGLSLEEWLDRVESDESCGSKKSYGFIASHCISVADEIVARLDEEASH